MKVVFSVFTVLFFFAYANAQTSWYVDQNTGSDSNAGLTPAEAFSTVEFAAEEHASPGDTVFIIGTYVNTSYDPTYSYSGDISDPYIWNAGENTIKLQDIHGTEDAYITFKPYDESTVIKGDAANIVRVSSCSYLQILDFEIQGEVDNIPLETALALQFLYRLDDDSDVLYRVPPGTSDEDIATMTLPYLGSVVRPSYTSTRGMYMNNVHHIRIKNNHIHHAPGTGLRVADCDYIEVEGNEIDNNSRKSYAGTHALVVTKATSMDTNEGYKIVITGNKVHHNYNEIYSWAPTKTFIHPGIDEGKGISLQRNQVETGWTYGRILIANNICYWNGYSGVHSNTGTRIDMINNTVYMNSYTGTITEVDDPSGNNIGISESSGSDIVIANNIVQIDASWGGLPINIGEGEGMIVANNLIYGGGLPLSTDADVALVETETLEADPLFTDSDLLDFSLTEASPAIGVANLTYAPLNDYNGSVRDETPDLGALEYFDEEEEEDDGASITQNTLNTIKVYPNPAENLVFVFLPFENNTQVKAQFYAVTGELIKEKNATVLDQNIQLNINDLPVGIYFIQLHINHSTQVVRIYKR